MKKRPSNRASRAMRARSQIFASSSTRISLPLVYFPDSPFSDLTAPRARSPFSDAKVIAILTARELDSTLRVTFQAMARRHRIASALLYQI